MSKKKNKDSNLLIILGIIVFATIVAIIITLTGPSTKTEQGILQEEGYTTTDEDAFYKKIVTHNTLDDYYNDIANNKNTEYEEYYFSKEAYDFIELKMSYYDSASRVLSINSDLRTNRVEYNYEISYNSMHLILEGNSDSNYDCNIVIKKNTAAEDINNACNDISKEISIFLDRREKLLSNKKIQELLKQPIKEYIEE